MIQEVKEKHPIIRHMHTSWVLITSVSTWIQVGYIQLV